MENDKNPAFDLRHVQELGEKIEKLSVVIGHQEKDGTNQHSRYDYISNEQMVTALRTSCLEHKISIIPSVVDYVENEFETIASNGKKKITIRTVVTMNFKIIDLETGFMFIESFVGAENDTGGKSFQQAVTQCTKYFYFKLFNVTSRDEIDGDSVTTPIGGQNSDKSKENAPKKEKQWLTEDQFNKALACMDPKQVKNVLDHYTTDTHGMKKDYREQLKSHHQSLHNG